MNTENVKNEALRLVEKLPEDVTWDDIMHAIYVRQSVEAGLADKTTSTMTIDKTKPL